MTTSLELMGDEVGKEVGEDAEQRQPRQAIRREDPRTAALPPDRGCCGTRGLLGSRNDRGPIFHENLRRKDRGANTVCVTPASRPGEAGPSDANSTPDFEH